MKTSKYLKCSSKDLASTAILVGDQARTALFEERLDDWKEVASNREYLVITGSYHKTPVSVVAVGIGAPSMAIAVEELASMGVKQMVRAGTMMSVDAKLGSLILAQAACRYEGTSSTYAPLNVPAVAEAWLYAVCRTALTRKSVHWMEGLVASCDGFYSQMAPPLGRSLTSSELDPEQLRKWGVCGIDMETSAFYMLCRYLRVAAVSLCAVTVDGFDKEIMPTPERYELERGLVDVVLQCVYMTGRLKRRKEV